MHTQTPSETSDLFRRYPCAQKALWSQRAFHSVARAQSFAELVPIARTILEFFEEEVTIVSGPISTGGFGTREKNIAVFHRAIQYLQSRHNSVFDQTPFETTIFRLAEEWYRLNPGAEYCEPILTDFYGPVFESGLIYRVAFIQGWESSRGARWERKRALELGLKIADLPSISP